MGPGGTDGGGRGIKLALVAYSAITFLLVGAFLLTDVLVILALSLDRVSDILITLFFLISLKVSLRPPDIEHVFGHARVQNVAVLIVSTVLIFFIGLETLREALPRLASPSAAVPSDLWIALVVTLISMVVIAVPSIVLFRGRGNGLNRAQLLTLLLDEFSCGVTLVAILLMYQGYLIADPIGSIMIGVVIVLTGSILLYENAAMLIGRSPDGEFEERVNEIAMSVDGVRGIHGLRAEYVGPDTIHADMHIEVDPETTVAEADIIIHQVRDKLMGSTDCRYCEIHPDPYRPPS
ncbi:MAG: cation transporter [Methanomassiliicoccus sp.]|nr:cation transporter [Methanomassiliicoccus sp.]